MSPEWPLETERLTLRPWTERDLDALYAIESDPENARWLYDEARDEAGTPERLALKRPAIEQEGDWLSAAAAVRETGRVVGDVSLEWASEPHRTAEIGVENEWVKGEWQSELDYAILDREWRR